MLSDVLGWTIGWGAGPSVRRRRRRAQVVYVLAFAWGVLLHTAPGRLHLDWQPMFLAMAESFARPYAEPTTRLVAVETEPVRAQTGDPVQDALLDAVAAIVARVGLARATGSRIARRAGVTSGAIYGRYETKADLLEQAIGILLGRRFDDDLSIIDPVLAATDPGAATARIVAGYLTESRREWRRFRIEAHLAARSHPGVAATLARVQEEAKHDWLDAIGAHTPEEQNALEMFAALGADHTARSRVRRSPRPGSAVDRLAARHRAVVGASRLSVTPSPPTTRATAVRCRGGSWPARCTCTSCRR